MNSPKIFLNSLKETIAENSSLRLFFAVPNVMKAFEEGDYTDVVYEHVSYFTEPSLRFLFSACGFNILGVEETQGEIFDSIYVDANVKNNGKSEAKVFSDTVIKQVEKNVKQFAARTNENIQEMKEHLKGLLDEGKQVVIWGVGARGVTVLNVLKDPRIEYAVDINPRKQGLYVLGTGQMIVKPEFLSEYKPDYVLVSNSPYEGRIKELLKRIGVKTSFFVVC